MRNDGHWRNKKAPRFPAGLFLCLIVEDIFVPFFADLAATYSSKP
jgi:hypothetical protein